MNPSRLPDPPPSTGQFGLMLSRRFAPFFWTQFLGAFNDNVFKNALIILIAYGGSGADPADSHVLINLAAGLFILPFFLFSATAGQICDKLEKSGLIRTVKLLEILIMVAAALAFEAGHFPALLALLFFMGAQSTFFGPVKYSLIPQQLRPDEVVGGNALVSMGTFLAILLGTITGGVLIQRGTGEVGGAVVGLALLGWLASRMIPPAAPSDPGLRMEFNPFKAVMETIGYARRVHSVFLSVLGISWFWFLGSAYLTQVPAYTRDVLKGNESVVTLLLTMFSVGIGVGSLLCERLSGKKVELGLVPLGSIGLSLFGLDLCFAYTPPDVAGLMDIRTFLDQPGGFRVLADLVLIGVSGGCYIVPLNAFIQTRTAPEIRARVIAANNILNALFMVLSTVAGALLLGKADIGIPRFFLVIVLLNAAVAAYIYSVVPEFAMRFLIWTLTHTVYRVRHEGLERVPEEGPALLVCNHVSYVDGPIIAGACRRPTRFVIDHAIYRMPVLHFIFRTGGAIPIASRRHPLVYEEAFRRIAEALRAGEVVCLFPEGKLTSDGEIDQFRPGVERILRETPVPVVPMALDGLWGSFFSHRHGTAMTKPIFRPFCRVDLRVGHPVPAKEATAAGLRERVLWLKRGRMD